MSFKNNDNNKSRKESVKHTEISGSRISRPSTISNLQQKPGHVIYEQIINLQSSSKPSTRMLKRKSPNYHCQTKACRQKFREKEKDGNRFPVHFKNVLRLPGKVKGNTFDRDEPAKNILPSFPNVRMRNLSGTNDARTKGDGIGCSPSVSSWWEDNDDATCSTSCSSTGSNDPFNFPHTTVVHPARIERDYCSDAESICWSSYNEEMNGSSFTKEEMAAEIHRLELHAYRCTMEALHASGPFSWEQESLITNLRIQLHISNDEHLMELRTLISNSRNSTF